VGVAIAVAVVAMGAVGALVVAVAVMTAAD